MLVLRGCLLGLLLCSTAFAESPNKSTFRYGLEYEISTPYRLGQFLRNFTLRDSDTQQRFAYSLKSSELDAYLDESQEAFEHLPEEVKAELTQELKSPKIELITVPNNLPPDIKIHQAQDRVIEAPQKDPIVLPELVQGQKREKSGIIVKDHGSLQSNFTENPGPSTRLEIPTSAGNKLYWDTIKERWRNLSDERKRNLVRFEYFSAQVKGDSFFKKKLKFEDYVLQEKYSNTDMGEMMKRAEIGGDFNDSIIELRYKVGLGPSVGAFETSEFHLS